MQRCGNIAMRPKVLSTLRSLANAILGKIGKPDRLETATRMALDADFSERFEPSGSESELARNVDQIDELMRIVGEPGTKAPPRPPKAQTFPDPRRRPRVRR